MKVMSQPHLTQTVTHLPPEVLALIVNYVRSYRSARAAQRDLWSFCLVSKDWYASTVKQLYEAPVLSSRNFAEFARTLSPPLSSRVRRVGLEDFVQHLDMGGLAYESKKTITSRLISRTKTSLRSFTAPAVSFSTTCLAPLSKCRNLEHLDLSRDVYDFTLSQLLRSLKPLSNLAYLSLPKDCEPFRYLSQIQNPEEGSWPQNLLSLHLNDSHEIPSLSGWTSFLESLPHQLTSLTLNNLADYDIFDSTLQIEMKAHQVQALSIRVYRCDDTYNFNLLSQPFPNISRINVPAMTSWLTKEFIFTSQNDNWTLTATGDNMLKPPLKLEVLVLEDSADFPESDHIRLDHLRQFIEQSPRLMRIEVPTAYLNIDEDDESTLDDMNETLTKRAVEFQGGVRGIDMSRAGIFMTESSRSMGVGLKRSFRYRGHD